jgi:FkbM family methyltransferase
MLATASLVVDVGANTGQYAELIRADGYTGRLLSLEPLSDAYAVLERAAQTDPLWECIRVAVGETSGAATINVSANRQCSSLLPLTAKRDSVGRLRRN